MQRVVLATGNSGKVRELQHLLETSGLECVAQTEFDVSEIVEDGLSFVENALKKARNASRCCNLPAIADDSGIEVAALNGRPGIYSARFAGEKANDNDNSKLLLKELEGIDDTARTARFVCVVVFMRHAEDPVPIICTGTWEGSILLSPRGENGFGYDPVFLVPELGKSAAELSANEKNARSHRAQALACLKQRLQAEPGTLPGS